MKLSSKGRYAVTAMLDIALHDRYGPVTLADISYAQEISLSYLEQLFAKLRRNGLVEGLRGPGGGYRLGRPGSEITIAEIIAAVDEKVDMTHCENRGDCKEGEHCLTHELWSDLSQQIFTFLSGITLADLVERPAVQDVVKQQVFSQGRLGTQLSRSAA